MNVPTTLEIELDTVTDDAGETVYEVSYDRSLQPTLVVVTAVAAIEECEPTDLRPLHDVVDTDALDRFVDGTWQRGSTTTLAFTFAGYHVEFRDPGHVRLEPVP